MCLAARGSKGPAETLTHVFWFEFLVAASNGRLLQLVNNGADHLLVLQPQLFMDDLHIPHRVHRPLHVDDIFVLESTCSDKGTQDGGGRGRVSVWKYSIYLFICILYMFCFLFSICGSSHTNNTSNSAIRYNPKMMGLLPSICINHTGRLQLVKRRLIFNIFIIKSQCATRNGN